MTINLSEKREQFIRSLVQGGRYASEEDVIEEALRLLEQQDLQRDAAKQQVESLLLKGLDSGPSTPMTSADWGDIEREGKQLIAAHSAQQTPPAAPMPFDPVLGSMREDAELLDEIVAQAMSNRRNQPWRLPAGE